MVPKGYSGSKDRLTRAELILEIVHDVSNSENQLRSYPCNRYSDKYFHNHHRNIISIKVTITQK